jgi:hypothetical protein
MQMAELPRISVVTSCFNAAPLVDDTLRSVTSQGYSRLEYIFVDGASTDNTLAIAQRYAGSITQLISEPDAGQYHGIQKGMALATGDVMAWLNGDDVYLPWTLALVGQLFAQFPQVSWIVGTPSFMNEAGVCTRVSGNSGTAYPRQFIQNGWFRDGLAGYLQQESMFWRRSLWDRVGGLDLKLGLAADFDLWRRFAEHAELVSVNIPLALFRQRPGLQRSSTQRAAYEAEVEQICSGLRAAPKLWQTLAARGEAAKHLCRMAIWRRSSVLAFSLSEGQWSQTKSFRPLARTSLADVLLASALTDGR